MLKFRFSRASLVQASALAAFLFPAAAAANTITVNSAADTISDDSACTLREAILSANTNTPSGETPGECAAGAPGHDTILFDIPGAGVHTIRPAFAFPVITEALTIDGYSQPGASPNTWAAGNVAVLLIEVDGTSAGSLSGGLLEISAGNSTVRGLLINRVKGNNSAALRLTTCGGNTVAGNWIGIDANGRTGLANQCRGVAIESSSGNTIGGLNPGDRNVINGQYDCGAGILISGSADNQVINNYIGTNAQGGYGGGRAGDMTGILIGHSPGGDGSTGNVIGGTTAEARNVISWNGIAVVLTGPGTSENIVQGNYIGVDSSNTLGVGNGRGGIRIDSSAHDNMIGGIAAGAGNTIRYNGGIGVSLDALPSPAGSGNAILGNLISDNSVLDIDLNGDGVTANDPSDTDAGPNDLQNFPVLTSVTPGAGSTTIQGSLDSAAGKQFRLEFFTSDRSRPGALGQNFLGSTTVTTDSSCHADFEVTFPVSAAPTGQVTATATDDHNNTSEFAPSVRVQNQYYTVAPCRVADTRNPPGPSGGPALLGSQVRTFPVAGLCGIPPTARAVAIVLAVWEPETGTGGYLQLYPAGGLVPRASAINFRAGVARTNFAVIPLSLSGEMSVLMGGCSSSHFFFDIYGYFQ